MTFHVNARRTVARACATIALALLLTPVAFTASADAATPNVAITPHLVSEDSGGPLVEITATVSGTSGVPTLGTISFVQDDGAIASCTDLDIDASASATCTIAASSLGTGPHTFRASYSGGGAYTSSSSSTIEYSVASVSVGVSSPTAPATPASPAPTTTDISASSVSAPSSPVDVAASANSDPTLTDAALVTWSMPLSNGGAPVSFYSVITENAATGTPIATTEVAAGSTSVEIVGLASGYSYDFAVVAANRVGVSPPSGISNVVVPVAVAPSKVARATGTKPGGTVVVSATTASPTNSSSPAASTSRSIKATGEGAGTLLVAVYPQSPIAGVPTDGRSYYDVSVSPGNTFAVVDFVVCDVPTATKLQWWNPAIASFATVSNQTSLGADGCVQVTVTGSSSPRIAQLYGTVVAVPNAGAATTATTTRGFLLVSAVGHVSAIAGAHGYGSATARQLQGSRIVGIARTASARGYWLAAANGAVFHFGAAAAYGETTVARTHSPIVAIAPTHDARGYWLASATGGVYGFGDARNYGSPLSHGEKLSSPVVDITASPNGKGYWLLASDGAVYSFGDAAHEGSPASHHLKLAGTAVSLQATSSGAGYFIVTSEGGVAAFGNARLHGSFTTEHARPAAPIVGIAPTGGGGYWLFSSNGATWSFGDARVLPEVTAATRRTSVALGI